MLQRPDSNSLLLNGSKVNKAGEAFVENVLKKRGIIAEKIVLHLTEQASTSVVEFGKEVYTLKRLGVEWARFLLGCNY